MTTGQKYMSWSKARSSFGSDRTARTCVPRSERLPPEGAGATGDSMGTFSSSTCPARSKLDIRCGYSSLRPSATKREVPKTADVVLLCDECVSRVVVLRQEALRVFRDGHFSTSDPKLPLLLYESLQVPVWIGFDGCCDVCFAHLSQLKREAIHALLTQNRTIWPSSSSAKVSPGHPTSGTHTLPKALGSQSSSPSNRRQSSTFRTESWVREQSHSESPWSAHNGISSFSDMLPQDLQKKKKDDDKSTVLCHFRGPLPFNTSKVSAMLPAGTSAAFSFIVRAVQKLNLTTRRRKQDSDNHHSHYPTNFSSLLQRAPPPVPSNLLQTPNKGKESSETEKVKVMLRVSPFLMADTSQFHALKLDIHKKQVTVLEPSTQNTKGSDASTTFTPKTFTFDATFGPESSQAKVCERSLSEVLQSVVAGADGCILNFGQTKEGTSYTMIGFDDSMVSLGIIPCAISWLFKLVNKKIDRTWANISVSVSAVEVCGETEIIRDLLSHVEAGDHTNKQGVYLLEDPVSGIQLCNNKVISAPTAEKAASLLDAALSSRNKGMAGCRGTVHQCHMFYTLHVCQKHIASSPTSGMFVDQSKLSLIDLGSCTRDRSKNNTVVCLVDLGNVIMAKLNRHNHVPNKGSKLAMLMQEALGNVNCRTTIIAHVSTLHEDLPETLCTIQIVSQIRRLQRNRKQACSSPGGRSLKEKKTNYSTMLKGFHYSGSQKHNLSLPCLLDDQEDCSGSNKSCDTAVGMNPNSVLLHRKVKGNQEFVPIIPSLQRSLAEFKSASSIKHCDFLKSISPSATKKETKKQFAEQVSLQPKTPDLECFKCNTFAELQDRLGGIDESDMVGLHSYKMQPANNVIKSEPLPRKDYKSYNNDKERGHPIQGANFIKDTEKSAFRHAVQAKLITKNLSSPPRLGAVSSSVQCERVTRSQMLTETLDKAPLPRVGLSSENYTLPPETRKSPMGKSPSSLTVGVGSPVSFPISRCEVISQFPTENQKDKATITVTVQQPLDLNGHDELIYSVVREVAIIGTNNEGKAAASNADHPSKNLQFGSQPVKIIDSIGEEQTAVEPIDQAPTSDTTCKASSIISTGKANPLVQNPIVNTQVDNIHPHLDDKSKESQTKDVSEDVRTTCGSTTQYEVSQMPQDACEIAPDQQNISMRKCNQDNGSKGMNSPINQKVSADLQMKLSETLDNSCSTYDPSSSPSVWLSQDKHNDYKKSTESLMTCGSKNTHSPKTTMDKKHPPAKLGSMDWAINNESLSRSVVDSPNKKGQKYKLQPVMNQTISENPLKNSNNKCLIEESSKLFSAKLEQLTSRSRSLCRSHVHSFDVQTIEESNAIFTHGSFGRMEGSYTSPRINRRHLDHEKQMDLGSKGCLELDYASPPAKSITSPALRAVFEEDHAVCWDSRSLRRVPRFFPIPDEKDSTQPSKPSLSNISPLNKLLSSTVVRKLSGTSPNLCTSPKSSRHSMNRSSSLSPEGFSRKQISVSSQSLPRKEGKASSSCPSRVLKGRVELLRASGDSLSSSSQDSSDIEELEESKRKMNLMTYTLPSPYSRITSPRKPKHCSGHASDNTSVLSGELPPAMCKTALLYNRNSLVSSGYESLKRDSETTYSSTSIHDSISDQSFSTAKSGKTIKKRNTGSNQRRPSLDTLQSVQRSVNGSKTRRTDQGTSDSYEIKVYEIDNMDSLQRRGKAGNKSVVCFSAKLKFLEHRQERIADVRAKYNTLKRELEQAKQHLMVDPGKWTREFDLWQTFEVDSLEHLEALELVTERLECQVNRCKAHVMMVTSFDASPKRVQKKRCWPPADNKGLKGMCHTKK